MDIEKKAERVTELALAGQGCAVWDEISAMSRTELVETLNGAQNKSPNANPKELRNLPAIVVETESFLGATWYRLSVVSEKSNNEKREILKGGASEYLPDRHECVNLPKPSDRGK